MLLRIALTDQSGMIIVERSRSRRPMRDDLHLFNNLALAKPVMPPPHLQEQ
jgi:hypothetical protein